MYYKEDKQEKIKLLFILITIYFLLFVRVYVCMTNFSNAYNLKIIKNYTHFNTK